MKPRLTRRTALGLLVAVPVLSSCSPAGPNGSDGGTPSATSHRTGGRVRLHITDPTGAELDLDGLRAIQSNAVGPAGYDDILLDAVTLEAVAAWPLEADDDGAPCLDLPDGGPYCLCLSWPTSHGYSALLADIPGPGEHDLAELAARSLHTRQGERIASATTVSEETTHLREATQAELKACDGASTWSERGAHAREALESASAAQFSLDRDLTALAPADAVVGVTLTRVPSDTELDALLGPSGPGAGGHPLAARLVIADPADRSETEGWTRTVARLQTEGGIAVGQVCDSHAMADLDDSAWDARVDALLAALPQVDVWEVGNELGGDWLGEDAAARMTRAARAVREAGNATTLLTLYHQLGQDTAATSTFTVAAEQVGEELQGLTDVVGLSVYPQWHPLGTAADRVLTTLARAFPEARVAVTELGYGAADLDAGPWWFTSPTDVAAARSEVAQQVTAAVLGRDNAWGAPFWWYYLEDEAAAASPGGTGDVATALAEAG